ncbi:MAG: RHS repeat-associated core domain-containing protein [Planctomycetes bacterium]|nr:RHS repeat-associated core domain-containing protein [Planctomycetota bacterium]
MTDSNGDLVETYDYDAYGTPTIKDDQGAVLTASSVGNPYMFTGRRLDAETGLYYFRARYFDTELGRFISRDPSGYVDGMGLYGAYYVPNGMDPSGNSRVIKLQEIKPPPTPQDNCKAIGNAFTAQVHRIQKAIKSGGSSCPDNSSEIKQMRNTMSNLNRNFNELDCPNKMDVAAKETFANELAHTGLDLGGMLPLVGAFFDGWNAERYYAEGNIFEGNIATAALAPGLGQLVTIGKYIGKFKKLFGGGGDAAVGVAGKVDEVGGLNIYRHGDGTAKAADGWKEGDRFLNLPNQGSAKANWKQNSGRLREEMGNGNPIFDSYRNPVTGKQIPAGQTPTSGGRFLNAERQLLESKGWKYNEASGAYLPPVK